MPDCSVVLSTTDHSRDSAGMTYVYPVVSRRAGGVSLGINLNPNNACNWHCIYCQVPNLGRGGPPPIDLGLLARELDMMLDDLQSGEFLVRRVPAALRRLVDIAFSGNGEPTSAREFPDAVMVASDAVARHQLTNDVRLRLITNGSLIDRRSVRRGLELLSRAGGEVWFKVDAADARSLARINGTRINVAAMGRRLGECGALCPTWVQTCLFTLDGQPLSSVELDALMGFLVAHKGTICGVHLYGLARPSAQTAAPRLARVAEAWLQRLASHLRDQGLTVTVSP
ncbi:MAG: radical SAM protein [Rhodocyclaceae bacterium]|jgi:wyosine [tRNA(Phe)-imidazoG37] synthetase (radical SAM superfamily)|nr:radical SAM protein [Rhodocyclaceae bacterium]MBK6552965.1 radical SAM protein [Rhodocyclaceae bacterium]MBK7815113.1 radical SAM protein [Rhodocyclaceae bacterium]MBK9311285.1 radical SAM protein [Rhodocyclaceae bacterium]MBK9953775.1 radical SAM protein [Rhodocyclaceae bacterium]